ncbi:MAG: sigma 54-interacting transcriptional regulator [Polyangiaceae bacterium]|nr:sigma 54-interacting transcriptional regulator [Polyangiaceae bacterium]
MLLAPGTVLHNRYEVLAALGRGGTGSVLRARDLLRGQEVALKLLRLDRAEALETFRAEFRALSRLVHPNLVSVYDFGRARFARQPSAYYTAALIRGQPLDRFATHRSWPEVRRALGGGLRGLGVLHRVGLRHGDFKPANLLVDADGHATLIDLGASDSPPRGTVSGTLGRIAPELLDGQAGDARADLYAVGVTLRELAALVEIPEDAARLAERLVDPDPGGRPPDVAEVLAALGEQDDELRLIGRCERRWLGRDAVGSAATALVARLVRHQKGPRVLVLHGPEGSGRSRALEECKWLAQLELQVIEADASVPRGVESMLIGPVAEGAPPAGLSSVLLARQRFAAAAEPTVFVLDDADLLDAGQTQLLWTFAHAVQPDDPIGLVLATTHPVADVPEQGHCIELGPLGETEIRSWVGANAPKRLVAELLRTSGGWPGEIATLLSLVQSGSEPLLSLVAQTPGVAAHRDRVARLTPEARRCLLACALSDGTIELAVLYELRVGYGAVAELQAAGWVVREGSGLRLTRMADAARLPASVDPELTRSVHRDLAEHWDRTAPDLLAKRVRHWALAGAPDLAEALLGGAEDRFARDPAGLRRAAEDLLTVRPSEQALLLASELCELAGDPARALQLAQQCLALGPADDRLRRAETRAGSSALRLGSAAESLTHLRRAAALATDPEDRAEVADLTCRALIQSGDYGAAVDLAVEALAWTKRPTLAAHLEEDLGLGSSYLGRDDQARTHLARAEQTAKASGSIRDQVRITGDRAIHEFRTGHFDTAEQYHQRALELADQHGLLDQVSSCALNLGSVLHRRGNWGGALDSYEKGLVTARALGKVRTRVTLHYDLAQLHADIGQFERAELELGRARAEADPAGLPFLSALCTMLAGELALARGDAGTARERLTLARSLLEGHRADRELADVELALAEVGLAERDAVAAQAGLEAARCHVATSSAEDLQTRWLLLSARLRLEQTQPGAALPFLEAAAERARQSAEQDLRAEIEAWSSIALDRQQAPRAARRHREQALELWERGAATLPLAMRDAFWRHPRRAILAAADKADGAAPSQEAGPSVRERQLERLLGIYRRLGSSLKVREVLETAMDAAIELTGAERGFVIVKPETFAGSERTQPLRIAVARSIDRERVGRSALKISRSIAERVMRTAEPLLTAEAQADARLSTKESVVALGLKSVACVPIPGPAGVLGALYLDNRFQRGRFSQADLKLLTAFADQVGIALTKARLYGELEARSRELEKERARIAEMLAERSREVDRLNEQIRAVRERFDTPEQHAGIVGRSAAMQRVFSMIPRVSSSPLTVLIQGESGTGKELVARAIHDEGPRAAAPFVSVNCAAVPEALLESELFGHVRGAFTGADRNRVGLLVHAGDGTLLLDEIGELPLSMQAKLLRVLQEREVMPLGSTRAVPVAARILSATNRRLREEVVAGRFREDLFYRLAVVEITLPPLRERLEDIPLLSRRLLEQRAQAQNRKAPTLSSAALRKLMSASWPGNVRQLENVLSQALLFCSGDVIDADDVALPTAAEAASPRGHRHYALAEAAEIAAALAATRYNAAEVSRRLGIPRTSLYRKLKLYGLERERT